ncbi:MAG: zinc ribbon domain-containing protein [Bacteriovorax sp.]|nr:zinc ribbon domain-containing protein [Rhizobacter sp.]
MPIYAYRCATCGHAKDVLQKMSDAVLTVCPDCGASTFLKQVTAAGFQLKGSGWYVTDFKGGAAAPPPADGAKADASKGDAPKGDAQKGESQKGDAPKGDAPKGDGAPAAKSSAPAAVAPAAAPAPPAASGS